MKHLLIILVMGIAVVGCKEKVITIKEFKENDTLRAEWMKKCKDDSGFEEGSCRNVEEAERIIQSEKLTEELNEMGYK